MPNFFKPLGLNLLAALIFDALSRSILVRFKEPQSRTVCEYLNDQGFYKEFEMTKTGMRAAKRSTSVGLRRMDLIDYSYFEQVVHWLAINSGIHEKAVDDIVRLNLTEIINNVLEHSGSRIGCYISAQAYPNAHRLQFTVLDLGIGFLESLRPTYPDLRSNIEAIHLAVQEGISSKARKEGKTRGTGLLVIRDFMQPRGKLEIISRDGCWIQTQNGRVVRRTMSFAFPGTCVILDFDSESVKKLQDLEGLDEAIPF